MKITFLQDDFPPRSFGGAGISTFELAQAVQKAGHEVFVITTCRKESEAGESEYQDLKIFSIASDYHERWRAWVSLYNPRVVRQVEGILKQIRPDVVHANNIHYHLSYASLKVAKRYAKAVVFTARDTMTFSYSKVVAAQKITWLSNLKQAKKRYNPFRNLIIKKYLRYVDRVFAVSDALKSALEQNGISPVETVHTGMDVSSWRLEEGAGTQFRTKYNIENKKVILFSGRLSPSKGGGKMVEALATIAKSNSDAALVVAGKIDEYAEAMKKKAEALGVRDKLVFTGWISGTDLKGAYAASDVVCVPSCYLDPFPRAVLEAMATGKPVVGTCFGGAPEVIVDGKTGYIVNPLHPEEIADKTLDLLKNPEKAVAFGKAGLERVKNFFDLKEYAACYLAAYLRQR